MRASQAGAASKIGAVAAAFAMTAMASAVARAQQGGPGAATLPPLPPPVDEPPSGSPGPSAQPGTAGLPSVPAQREPGAPPSPPLEYAPTAAASGGVAIRADEPTHAPHDALWVGARLGLLAYGGGLYIDDPNTGEAETTGNFIGPAAALEVNVGARLARRYIPFVAFELGLGSAGRRFDGASTQTSTTFAGIGFRYVAGDVDSVAFVSELSFGFRSFHASNDTGSWSVTGFEPFRVGLGAEIRLTTHFTISPLVTLSEGALTDTSGNIAFGPHQGDGLTGPPFVGNGTVPDFAQTNYYAIVFGCGAHFDLIGR